MVRTKTLEGLIKYPLLLYHKDVIIFVQKLIKGVGCSSELLGSRSEAILSPLFVHCLSMKFVLVS